MVVAWAHRRSGYIGCCCVALVLTGCPQLLGDDFLMSRDLELPDAGLLSGRDGGSGAAGGAGASSSGGEWDAGLLGSSGAGGRNNGLPNCNDGTRNQDETAVDCGGSMCTPCNCQYGPFHDIVQVDGLGTDDRWGPMLAADGAWLYYSVQTATRGQEIFRASRSGTATVFSNAQAVANVNGSTLDSTPFLTADQLTLYFSSDRAGGLGNRDLWAATRASAADAFSAPEIVPAVNSSASDLLPRSSADGLTLMFESTRAGGSGSSDIWAAERSTPSGAFGAPRPRADLNTPEREEGFSLSGDQLTIVLSSSRGGDSMDLFLATRAGPNADFGPLTPIIELNGSLDELDPGLSRNGGEIFFTSTRDGDVRIYHALRDCQ